MPTLFLRKTEGSFENILVRDGRTRVAAHIQIPVDDHSRRVVVAMPAGKAALCFETAQPAGWTLAEAPAAFAEADGQNGVSLALVSASPELAIPVASILLHHTLIARFGDDPDNRNENRLKNLIRSGGIKEIELALGMSLLDLADRGRIIGSVADAPSNRITFTRRALDGKHRYRLEFTGGQAVDVRLVGDSLRVSRKNPSDNAPLRLVLRASTDFERLTPVSFIELVNDRGRALAEKDPHFAEAIRHFEFLSYREKFLAGSWNFLSYFGRDTLISLRIMWPVLSPLARRVGIQSVANAISEDGIVNVTDEWTDDRAVMDAIESFFREYDRGNLERARHIMRTIVDGTVPEHPFLDVLDQTFMFPPAAAHWFRELGDGDLSRWLQENHPVLGRTESNLITLLRNGNYLLKAAAPYIGAWQDLRERHRDLAPAQIVAAHPDEFKETGAMLVSSIAGAANWRDTYNLPWHFRSEDINVNLVPMAVDATREMIARIRAMGRGADLLDAAKTHALDVLREYLEEPGRFVAAREAWNWDRMREHFLVRRSVDEVRRNLERYLEGLANGEVTWGDRDRGLHEREAMLRCRESGVTVADFLRSDRVPETVKEGLEFTALLLDPAGQPLPLMHCDDVFFLLFGNPAAEQVRKIVRPLMLSYPFGLGFMEDDSGMAITNNVYAPRDIPALQDPCKNAWVKFGPDEYHGRGAWPWTLFALIHGVHNLVWQGIDPNGNLRNGLTPEDVERVRTILLKTKTALVKLGPLATSEVFKYAPARAGEGVWQAEPMGISTPIQLWSAAPANMLIDEALERISLVSPCRR
ncbi:MAG: hypothetical protein KA248_14480 [Kiritimatiellae bacterium]|nr:hypothetical protein [Kiritimatiellia bacterium]